MTIQRAVIERPPLANGRPITGGVERESRDLCPVAGGVESGIGTGTLGSEDDEILVTAVVG